MSISISITGPECSGKTTLAKALAEKYKKPYVEEFARSYLEKLDRPYEHSDLTIIAKGQLELEEKALAGNPSFIFCDTDLTVIKIWSEEKFNELDPWLKEQWATHLYDFSILCKPDFPWEPDPLRENELDRDKLYKIYERNLVELKKPFTEVGGPLKSRVSNSCAALEAYFG